MRITIKRTDWSVRIRQPLQMTMKTPTVKKPRRAHDEALWASRTEQIIDAAARLFAKYGYADADTQLLADELGVGKGTIYRYFPSKRDLFLAAADRVMVQMRERIDASIQNVAERLGIPEGTVKSRLHYARNWLSQNWSDQN